MEITPIPILDKKEIKNAKRNATFPRLLKQRKMMQAPDTRGGHGSQLRLRPVDT